MAAKDIRATIVVFSCSFISASKGISLQRLYRSVMYNEFPRVFRLSVPSFFVTGWNACYLALFSVLVFYSTNKDGAHVVLRESIVSNLEHPSYWRSENARWDF